MSEPSVDPFGAAELGSAAHEVFEGLFALPADERSKTAARQLTSVVAAKSFVEHSDLFGSREARVAYTGMVWRRVIGLWQLESPGEVPVRSVEWKFDVEIAGTPLTGFIDRVDDSGLSVSVVDYKTGKVPNPFFAKKGVVSDYERQIQTYGLVLREQGGVSPTIGRLLYTTAPGPKEIRVDVSPAALDNTQVWLSEAWRVWQPAQEELRFPAVQNTFCKWCPGFGTCAVGRGEVASVELSISVPRAEQPAETFRPGFVRGRVIPPVEAAEKAAELKVSTMAGNYTHNEPKPWEGDIDPATGRLALSSAASIALFGLVETAVEKLVEADQPVTAPNVKALAGTFLHIVSQAQLPYRADGLVALGEGSHARMRGALHTALRTCDPIPFGGDQETWDAWVSTVLKRTKAIAATALSIFEQGITDSPWSALCSQDATATAAA